MMPLKRLFVSLLVFCPISFSWAKADINVVTSIKPVHSLVSSVMKGVGSPYLILDGASSPHTYSLKPSEARKLQDAELVFWMGDEIETFLKEPIKNISGSAAIIKLLNAHGLKRIEFREGGMFDDHGHDDHKEHAEKEHDHGHDDHKEHAEKEHDHGHDDHEKHAEKEHDQGHDDHEKHDNHAHGEIDPHVWLDPVNAIALVHEIEEALVKADPAHAAVYEENARKLRSQLNSLVSELRDQLEPVQDKGFIVFHDAYHYFEQRFDVSAVGSITVSPEVLPGAQRISELREKIMSLSATCIFSEPQFEPKLVKSLVEGSGAKTGVLDPLGASIASGPDMYFQLLRNMASSIKTCLAADN
jgi:zinc transport system substrate-binding protein